MNVPQYMCVCVLIQMILTPIDCKVTSIFMLHFIPTIVSKKKKEYNNKNKVNNNNSFCTQHPYI